MVNSKQTKYWYSFSNWIIAYLNISLTFVTWNIFYSDKVILFKILVIFMILYILFYIDLKIYFSRKNYSKKDELQPT